MQLRVYILNIEHSLGLLFFFSRPLLVHVSHALLGLGPSLVRYTAFRRIKHSSPLRSLSEKDQADFRRLNLGTTPIVDIVVECAIAGPELEILEEFLVIH